MVVPLEPELDWSVTLASEVEPEVRRAMALRLVREGASLAPVLRLAHDPDWQVRSLAAEGLIALGSDSLAPARELARSEHSESRAVGVRVLVALDDYEWMEEHLL
jgi:HEAT repeat protein